MNNVARSVLGGVLGFIAGVLFGVLPTVLVAVVYAALGAWAGYRWEKAGALFPLLFLLPFLGGCTTTVDQTEDCILTRYGRVIERHMDPGFHWTPISSATCFKMVDHNFPDSREGKETIEAQTHDPITVEGDVAVVYAYDPATVYDVFLEKRSASAAEVEILNAVREGYRNALAGWYVNDIFSNRRAFLSDSVKVAIQRKIGRKAIIRSAFVRDIRAPKSIEEARIASAQQAQVLNKQQQQFIIDSVQARSVVIQARAEAEARTLQGTSYQKNPALLRLEVAKAMAGICGEAQTCILGQQFVAGWTK